MGGEVAGTKAVCIENVAGWPGGGAVSNGSGLGPVIGGAEFQK